jgi:triacylglycerol lipase
MKSLILSLICVSFAYAGSGSSTKPLQGSYPIVLSHGILGFDDTRGLLGGAVKYWGGMDSYLRSQGAPVLTPGTNPIQSVSNRAIDQKNQINSWMAANGYSKVHIIAHSQGALVSRYMVSSLGMSSKVASVTTVNGVNRGTPVADIALAVIPSWLQPSLNVVVNLISQIVYGKSQQDIIAMTSSMTVANVNALNSTNPNKSGVDYFSYGSKITLPDLIQHPLMGIVYPITWTGGVFNGQGGDNDGVVPLSAQKWGTWKGGPSYGIFTTGVDHVEAINFAQTGQTWYDVEGYYLKMASNAKANQ